MFFLGKFDLQKQRYNKILPFLGKNILELGCGYGFLPNLLQQLNYNGKYTGIDQGEELIMGLKHKYAEFNFIKKNLDEIGESMGENFDTIVATAVIEHIYNQKNFFLTAINNLGSGGKIIITTPTIFGNDVIYPLLCKCGFRKGNGALSDHIVIYNRERFNVVANDFGLKIQHFEHFEFSCNQIVVFGKE